MIPLILSNSSISVYLRCRYRYLLSEVWRIPAEPSVAMVLGTAVHAGIADYLEARDHDEAMTTTMSALALAWPSQPDEEYSVIAKDAIAMLDLYVNKVAPTFRPELIEAPFLINLDGVNFSGVIDAADDDVHDTKTTSMLSKFKAANHQLQVTGYARGYRWLTGNWPRKLYLDVLTRNGKYKQVEIESDDRGFRDVLSTVAEGIAREDYTPTGAQNGGCYYCPFAAICRHSITRLD